MLFQIAGDPDAPSVPENTVSHAPPGGNDIDRLSSYHWDGIVYPCPSILLPVQNQNCIGPESGMGHDARHEQIKKYLA